MMTSPPRQRASEYEQRQQSVCKQREGRPTVTQAQVKRQPANTCPFIMGLPQYESITDPTTIGQLAL